MPNKIARLRLFFLHMSKKNTTFARFFVKNKLTFLKSFQDRIKAVTLKGWISCGVWCAIYIAFVVWVAWGDWASLGWLVLLPIIADVFTT